MNQTLPSERFLRLRNNRWFTNQYNAVTSMISPNINAPL
jgi:hypothetical protein